MLFFFINSNKGRNKNILISYGFFWITTVYFQFYVCNSYRCDKTHKSNDLFAFSKVNISTILGLTCGVDKHGNMIIIWFLFLLVKLWDFNCLFFFYWNYNKKSEHDCFEFLIKQVSLFIALFFLLLFIVYNSMKMKRSMKIFIFILLIIT